MKVLLGFATVVVLLSAAAAKDKPTTLKEIQQALIRESIARYTGSCPCPYNTDRGGKRCGKRSAYRVVPAGLRRCAIRET